MEENISAKVPTVLSKFDSNILGWVVSLCFNGFIFSELSDWSDFWDDIRDTDAETNFPHRTQVGSIPLSAH